MTTAELVVPTNGAQIMERVLIEGDLAKLKPQERVTYYNKVCESLNINPLTKPFDYINLNGKLTLYALKNCTDQLRKIHGVSITQLERQRLDDLYVVTAYAKDGVGRIDSALGVVYVKGLVADNLANALMKAETKAKRRVTLSLCGLGWTDESEVESIPNARTVVVDQTTGEVIEQRESEPEPSPKKRPPTRAGALDHYVLLYDRATEMGIKLDDTYEITDSDGLDQIIEKGLKVKGMIDALKAEEF